jgi:hypothetical protein
VTAFFTNADQIGLPQRTVDQLVNEGITLPDDLVDFDKDTIAMVAENLRRPGGREPNPDPNAAPGSTIPTQPYVFSAKSQQRLLAVSNIVRYYQDTGRNLTAANIRYNPVVRNFQEQYKALEEQAKKDPPEVPKITKTLPVLKWAEAFDDHLTRRIGKRNIPLAYVTREEAAPAGPPPALAANLPHSEQYGSVKAELIALATHNHPLYRDDNEQVYYALEEATRTTQYAASLKPFQRGKDGRSALFAIKNQYAGEDKWESERKRQEDIMHNRIWKGQSNFTLEKFVGQHRNAYVMLQQCAEHIAYQLPNERTRVTYLLDNIQCSDATLQAAIAAVRQDKGADGMMNDFEAAVAYLLPSDPVAKKRTSGQKRGQGLISDTTGDEQKESAEVSVVTGGKPARGKTGVEFRFYKKKEYEKLTTEQKEELREFRRQSRENGVTDASDKKKAKEKTGKAGKGGQEKVIAAAVKQQIAALKQEADEDQKTESAFKDYILSVVQGVSHKKPKVAVKSTAATEEEPTNSTLKSILKKVKFST